MGQVQGHFSGSRYGKYLAQLLLATALVAGMAAPARADFNIATGLKWVPLRYTNPVSATGATLGSVGSADMYGWQTTSLDNYLAFFFHEQVGIQLSLDLGWSSFHTDVNGMNNLDRTFFQFGLAIGGKFYLNRPTAQRVSPYLYVDFYFYRASISTNEANIPNDQVGVVADLHSPLGFNLAFGAEYFFTTSFSLGAEVLGLRYAYVQGSFDLGGNNRFTEREMYLTAYTGITINYRFLATASVRTYEEEEDRQSPRPARRPVRRPKPKPVEENPDDQGQPESVD